MARAAAKKKPEKVAKGKKGKPAPAPVPAPPPAERRKGHGVHSSPRCAFVLPPDLKAALDRYCNDRSPRYEQSEVLRVALREHLRREGALPKA